MLSQLCRAPIRLSYMVTNMKNQTHFPLPSLYKNPWDQRIPDLGEIARGETEKSERKKKSLWIISLTTERSVIVKTCTINPQRAMFLQLGAYFWS
jgi:hypothetical protein